ncbi:MAG: hypothetical protein ACAH59_12790 [Pseudobdellovibrionaceae bacterium]
MTVEYILLLSLFVFFVMGALSSTPQRSFDNAGPKLGARVEKHLTTGEEFMTKKGSGTSPTPWE